MGTIKLTLRLDKPLIKTAIEVKTKDGIVTKYKYPIELIYQISGKRKYFNTGQKVRYYLHLC